VAYRITINELAGKQSPDYVNERLTDIDVIKQVGKHLILESRDTEEYRVTIGFDDSIEIGQIVRIGANIGRVVNVSHSFNNPDKTTEITLEMPL